MTAPVYEKPPKLVTFRDRVFEVKTVVDRPIHEEVLLLEIDDVVITATHTMYHIRFPASITGFTFSREADPFTNIQSAIIKLDTMI